MGVGNRRDKDRGHEKIWHGCRRATQTVCSLVIYSSQPPKDEVRLGWVAKCVGRSNYYLGRGRARIETGPTKIGARVFFTCLSP
jgi:hypothetical protein